MLTFQQIPSMIINAIQKDLSFIAPDTPPDASLEEAMLHCVEKPDGRQFIFILDEWDAVIRESVEDEEAQERYLNLLRGWFKNSNFTPKVVAAAYMTGILPIKKDGSQSAISDFQEYSMLHPGPFAKFTGFSENEVKRICKR